MKKSSLGRRSSLMSSGRLSVADKNVSRFNDGKKSLIPKPCSFGGKTGRSSSVERDLNASSFRKDPPPTLQRSKSYHNIDFQRATTPCFTPVQYNARNTGSMYSRLQMSEGGGRSSSMGGLKSAKKDSRPVVEKSFQIASQQKIQEFFMAKAPEYLEKGSIKPMTTTMFADLVNFLMAKFDKNIVVSKTNPIDGVLLICKTLLYRGKAEKSWIRTVNTPHSWPYVVSFLVWLVELYEVSEALDVYEAMYPENTEGDAEVNDFDFKVLVPHLLKGFILNRSHLDDTDEFRQILMKHKQASNIDEEEIKLLQLEYAQLQEELNNSEDAADEAQLQELRTALEAFKKDIKKTQEYNYSTENYVTNMNEKHIAKLAIFQDYEKRIEALKEEKEKLQEFVSQQAMSQAQKKEIETNLALLQREIQQLNEMIDEYKDEIYKEDLKLVGVKGAFNKLVQAYNKEIIVNLAMMPELKSAEIDDVNKLLVETPDAGQPFQYVDDRLAEMKKQLKTCRHEVENAIENTKLKLQQKEDEFAHEQDELDSLENECSKLENVAANLRKALQNDKEQTKKMLADLQTSIEQERKKIESESGEEENELSSLKEKKEMLLKDYDEYVNSASKTLKNKLQLLKDFEAKFQQITKQKMEERERMIAEILNK